VIRRGVHLFDELIVAVGINPEKRELFTLEERSRMIRTLLKDVPAVRVEQYTGLTVDFVRQSKATPSCAASATCRTCATSSSSPWPTGRWAASRPSSSWPATSTR
jgi:nicotinamide mononucleotide adenylyltransferase